MPSPLDAGAIVDQVLAGQPVELDGATIVGDLDLRLVDTARRVLRCTNCTFLGSIRSSNVIFERVVDLSGSIVGGRLDFEGAVFRDTFLIRATPLRAATVEGPTSFALATFHGRASFEGLQLAGEADFRVAQFLGDASFVDADFGADARFDSTIFAGRTQFSGSSALGGMFAAQASFPGVNFQQKADFRQRSFVGPATFAGATFESVDFTLAVFQQTATFDDASIEGAASFRVVTFLSDLSFQHVVLRGPTDFEAAILVGEAEFFGTSATNTLSLRRITTAVPLRLDMVRAKDFQIDLDRLDDVETDTVREDVLTMVEESARVRGDLGLANEAVFRRSQLQTARANGADRVMGLAGELIGGYLVKPIYPLRALLVMLAIGMLVRTTGHLVPSLSARSASWDLDPEGPTGNRLSPDPVSPSELASDAIRSATDPARERLLRFSKAIAIGLRSGAETLRAAFRLKPRDVPDRRREDLSAYGVAFLAGLEWLGFKALIAIFLVCMANSNPTFKQLVEAVT